jgi:hypothetical protein
MIGLSLSLVQLKQPPDDSTPGGADDVLLLAEGTSGLLLADGANFLTLST